MPEEDCQIDDDIEEECRHCGERLPIRMRFVCGDIECPKCKYINSFGFDTHMGMFFDELEEPNA